jgi:hypothetical protein
VDEAWRIMVEKTAATAEIPQHVLHGTSPLMLAIWLEEICNVFSEARHAQSQTDRMIVDHPFRR